MKFSVEEINEIKGNKAHLYTIRLVGSDSTLLDDFINENAEYIDDLNLLLSKMRVMVERTGCPDNLFKVNEGIPGDGVVALYSNRLRLYCLRHGNVALFIGSGGYKPHSDTNNSYQAFPVLNEKAKQMKEIAKIINKAIIDKDVFIDDNGLLKGRKVFSNED